MCIDRSESGVDDFHPNFEGVFTAPLPPLDGEVALHIFIDVSSVEIFGNGGLRTMTARIFPAEDGRGFGFFNSADNSINSISIWSLRPSMGAGHVH